MNSDLCYLTLAQVRDGLRNKKFSSKELVSAFIKRIEQYKHLNAFIELCRESAIKQAEFSDKKLLNGNDIREIEGIPIAVKDLFCTKNIKTTAGSKILENFVPPYESTVTQNLWNKGAVCLGKTNPDEFAMGSSTTTSIFGPTKNPWKRKSDNKDLVAGGSSGGSAVAIAAHLCAGAAGTDTGGSIRQPASYTGTVGIKPTYGLCSRYGIIAFASSLDQAGPMTKTVRDAAIMLNAMAGYDPKDSTSVNIQIPNYEKSIGNSIKGMKIGIPKEYKENKLDKEINDLWLKSEEWLKNAGAEIVHISLPHTKYALPVYYIIAPAEASSNLARYDGIRYGFRANEKTLEKTYENTRGIGFGKEVVRRILIGTYVLSAGHHDAYYIKAKKVRSLIHQDFIEAFNKVDAILAPTAPSAAFALDEAPTDPVLMYLNDIFTIIVNLAGLPAISVPAGLTSDGLPLGMQLIAPHFKEDTLFTIASVMEDCAKFPYWRG